ncbi:MAG: hypothetical protein HZB39_05995 [Planctomycetes bacterium]|nr:hypothetical protein [Planctomycetota bacterium]
MSEQLAVAFDDDVKSFEPGATVRGRALWLLSEDPVAIEVRLFWHTAGKGDVDLGIVGTTRFDTPGTAGDRPFEFVLPMRPWSCSGRLVSVIWSVEIVALPREDSQHFTITVGPGGREVILRGGALSS